MVLALGAALSGCTGQGDAGEEQASLFGFVDPDDPVAVFESFHRDTVRVQERIVECMAEAGFEYRPVLPAKNPAEGGSLTLEEYQERYGWGMMSSWEETLTGVPADLDPNAELREQMDRPTLQAWELALYGHPDTWYDDEVLDGCEQWAEFEVNAFRHTEAWDVLEPLLHEVPYRAMADPRWAEADRDWSRCMAEAGYDLRDEDDLLTTISERVFDVWEVATPPPGEPPPQNRLVPMPWFVETEAWGELVQFELDIIQAHVDCTQGVDRDLLAEYQQKFLDENQELIQQLQAELADLQGP